MITTPVAADHRAAHRRRPLAALAAAALAASAVTTVVVPVAGAAPAPLPENAAASAAVTALSRGSTEILAVPAGFAATFGYTPVRHGSMMIKPTGECSSPVPLPTEFETACKAHDLGYDLLRYARLHDQPLGPWARQTVDATLEHAMRESCTTRPEAVARARCTVMAAVASVFVDLNSRREGYGSPVVSSATGRAEGVAR
ncbi:hypothetical protein [Nocardia shimofusensis]|uniref:hypothetical protein n=1 Tax=Nocardia shimofusensis TaxID=228596 RepID=UPI00083793F3|nr:hypothetical protein [Nocardia shimofusensis]